MIEMKTNPIKKVIAVHDLSGLGRCSLAAAIPILSVMGSQVCPLPTALLSSQTDGFENFTFHDMTGELVPYFEHMINSASPFNAFYSGFLGSSGQIEKVEYMLSRLSPDTMVLIDPVMGDHGALYSTHDDSMVEGMRTLTRHAHIITPNVTEAFFLLGETPRESYDVECVEGLVRRLCNMTGAKTVVTGVELDDRIASAFSEDGREVSFTYNPHLKKHYPGTGDIFASILLGRLLQGKDFKSAVESAAGFVYDAMKYSMGFDYPAREGVLLEAKLSSLA